MGAGASAIGMPLEKRREMYEIHKDKYTLNDLDALATEEKQAWLEIRDERENASVIARSGQTRPSNTPPAGQNAAQTRHSSDAIRATAAATAAATAIQGSDGVAQSDGSITGGVRPQSKATRMSYHLPPQYESAETGDRVDATGRTEDPCAQTEDNGKCAVLEGIGRGMQRQSLSHGNADIPAWRRVADEVETAIELCVGDVVRARDKECSGMWFEGVLTAIHDAFHYTVDITTGQAGPGVVDCITVGNDDIVRVMPWFCIEVGDSVECQPEGEIAWCRGTVLRAIRHAALYVVMLGEGPTDGDDGGNNVDRDILEVPESRIRKITSARSASAQPWRKVRQQLYLSTDRAPDARNEVFRVQQVVQAIAR